MLSELIDAHYAAIPARHANHLTASRWSSCDRKMWFTFRNVRAKQFDGRMQRLLSFGHIMEPVFCEWIEAIGGQVAMREAEIKNDYGQVIARIDGILIGSAGTFRLIEFKTMNDKRFKEMLKKGVPDEYVAQVQLEMHGSRQLSQHGNQLTECVFFAYNKDTSELFDVIIPYDQVRALTEWQRIHTVIDLDAMPYGDTNQIQCRWCDYKAFCHGGAIPDISCKTCANVNVNDGVFECDRGSSVCDAHIIHPQIMELGGYEVIATDRHAPSVTYPNFVNGVGGLSSLRIRELADSLLLDEPLVAGIVSTFDATVI